MALASNCALLLTGQDSACKQPARKYYQQAVAINKSDIDPDSITVTKTDFDSENPTCAYNVQFSLKDGKTGHFFIGPEAGSSFFGSFDKANSDLGHTQYTHNASVLVVGSDEEAMCIIDSLSKGLFVVAFQFTDGTVVIYGLENGLTAQDFTYDPQAGGGGQAIVLSSLENAPENNLPLVYKSAIPGNETADFDSAFANTGS